MTYLFITGNIARYLLKSLEAKCMHYNKHMLESNNKESSVENSEKGNREIFYRRSDHINKKK
jgi:hypothetical protein